MKLANYTERGIRCEESKWVSVVVEEATREGEVAGSTPTDRVAQVGGSIPTDSAAREFYAKYDATCNLMAWGHWLASGVPPRLKKYIFAIFSSSYGIPRYSRLVV